jgi:general secretion pathway protein K
VTPAAPARQRGFALVAVLWAAMLLALIAASILQTSRSEARIARNRTELAALKATADAALNLAVLGLLERTPDRQPPLDGSHFVMSFAGQPADLRIEDESGKIDLNMAQEGLLRRVLIHAGLDVDAAQALVDKILDWRESGPGKRLNGAKAPDYAAAGLSYGPRNGPFESVAELGLVLGMTPELMDRISPWLTVYAQTPWVDPDFAPPDVLLALGGMDELIVSPALAARIAQSATPGRATGQHLVVVPGHAYTIDAELTGPDRMRVRRSAVVRVTGNPAQPLLIYRWD